MLAAAFAAGATTPTIRGDLAVTGRETIDLGGYESAYALSVQPDGKLLVGGGTSARDQADRARWVLMRFAPDGRLDPGFGNGGVEVGPFGGRFESIDAIRQLAVTADGRIVAAGIRGDDAAVARYQADGSPDPTFGGGDGVTPIAKLDGDPSSCKSPTGLVVGPDGTTNVLLSVGCGGESGELVQASVVRLDAAGVPDKSFDHDGSQTFSLASRWRCGYAGGLALQADGRLLVGGGDGGCYERRSPFRLARINPDGTLDASFGPRGRRALRFAGPYAEASDLATDAAGRIVLAGFSGTSEFRGMFAAARLTPMGTPDASFGNAGRVTPGPRSPRWSAAFAVALGADGAPVLAGAAGWNRSRAAVAKLTSSGALARYWREPRAGCLEAASDVAVTANHGVFIVGTTRSTRACGKDANIELVRPPM